jgi:hypothetical protein
MLKYNHNQLKDHFKYGKILWISFVGGIAMYENWRCNYCDYNKDKFSTSRTVDHIKTFHPDVYAFINLVK